jgi:hypothetical protein
MTSLEPRVQYYAKRIRELSGIENKQYRILDVTILRIRVESGNETTPKSPPFIDASL